MNKREVILKSTKVGSMKHINYDKPITGQYEQHFKDGDFLIDSLCGLMVAPIAKKVEEGVWESCRKKGHFMYEFAINEETGEKIHE